MSTATLSTETNLLPKIEITRSAQNRLLDNLKNKNTPDSPLKFIYLNISGGGCAGVECTLEMKSELEDIDTVVYRNDNLVIYGNLLAADAMQGLTIDFSSQLIGQKFIFNKSDAKHSCSCGKSFSIDT